MALSFMRDTVTVLRAPVIKKHGLDVLDWPNAAAHVIKHVQVTAQATSREFGDRVVQLSDRRTFRADFDADVKPGDRIVYEGTTYEVEGEVFHTKSPTGRASSTRCTLVRWEG